jgi:SAM-dependent methyltransferase
MGDAAQAGHPQDVKTFDSAALSAALDEATAPVIDHLMDYFAPESPYLTFGAPGAARTLSMYGRTVLADRDPFGDPFNGVREEGIEVRVAGPEDPLVFPPGRFGLVHARWTGFAGSVVPNLVRWLRPGGVLLLETPDDYPARNLPRGPYQAVSEAVCDRLDVALSVALPGRLVRHGLLHVGVRHELPSVRPFHDLLEAALRAGAPWPQIEQADLEDWRSDPVAATPALTNVMVWGVKTSH